MKTEKQNFEGIFSEFLDSYIFAYSYEHTYAFLFKRISFKKGLLTYGKVISIYNTPLNELEKFYVDICYAKSVFHVLVSNIKFRKVKA